MAEYIEREAAKEALSSITNDSTCPIHIAAAIDQMLDSVPAADVAPVVHGRWDCETGIAICSECKCGFNILPVFSHYCPNCGAKMDL